MRPLAVLVGGELYTPQGIGIGGDRSSDTRAIATAHDNYVIDPRSMGGVDEIVGLLARVVKLAQTLNANDARRAREIMEAAKSAIYATTRLDRDDQQAFEMALRQAARQ